MRIATSQDILAKRPSSWPKPPPGFTTKKVLGPGSDFPQRGSRNRSDNSAKGRKRRTSDDRYNSSNNNDAPLRNHAPEDDHPLLSGGLKTGRAGFSVEEMEAERASKRTKAAQREEL